MISSLDFPGECCALMFLEDRVGRSVPVMLF